MAEKQSNTNEILLDDFVTVPYKYGFKTDIETEMKVYDVGSQLKLNQGVRHRLIGLDNYAVVAEIWQHTDKVPSDEDDIIRVQDDFGR